MASFEVVNSTLNKEMRKAVEDGTLKQVKGS